METLVIGVGAEGRGDDSVGLHVARRLAADAPEGVRVIEAGGEGTALMDAWEGFARVILVDAARSGARPGTIHRITDLDEAVLTASLCCSTHAFGVAEGIALARGLDRAPGTLILYAVEGGSFEPGFALSPAVEEAAGRVLERIKEECSRS